MEPVLIAGAGPVGLAAALLLARWQVPTIVIEAAAERSAAGSRAICFQRDVLDIFDRVGCAEEMVAEGVTWTTGRTYYGQHELFAVTFPNPGAGTLPPWINISQARVERLLLDRATSEPLIELVFGHPIDGLSVGDDCVEVNAGTPSGSTVLRGSHLVAADGARSTVRQLLGIGFPGRSFDDQFLICDIRADLPFPNERRFFFDPEWNPGRQVLVHQCPDRVWRIDWQVPEGFDLAAERASGGLDARVRQVTKGAPYEIVWATAYRFHERVAAQMSKGRVFLAGDAAHVYAPFGARGLNSGIADAENIAWKLGLVLHDWAPSGLLASYHDERWAAAQENLRVTSQTMEFLAPQTVALRHERTQLLEQAMADPKARSLINSGKLAEPFWYTEGPLTTLGPSLDGFPTQPGALRPPVPGVLCPDGPCDGAGSVRRLRELFGAGFVVLTESKLAAESVGQVAAAAIPAPVASYSLAALDSTARLKTALGASADSVHVVRPDGFLAAVLPEPDPGALIAALNLASGLARTETGPSMQ